MSANNSYGVSGMKDVFNQTAIQGTPALPPSYQARLLCCSDHRPAQPGTGEDGPCRLPGAWCSLGPLYASGQKEAPKVEDRKWRRLKNKV